MLREGGRGPWMISMPWHMEIRRLSFRCGALCLLKRSRLLSVFGSKTFAATKNVTHPHILSPLRRRRIPTLPGCQRFLTPLKMQTATGCRPIGHTMWKACVDLRHRLAPGLRATTGEARASAYRCTITWQRRRARHPKRAAAVVGTPSWRTRRSAIGVADRVSRRQMSAAAAGMPSCRVRLSATGAADHADRLPRASGSGARCPHLRGALLLIIQLRRSPQTVATLAAQAGAGGWIALLEATPRWASTAGRRRQHGRKCHAGHRRRMAPVAALVVVCMALGIRSAVLVR